MDPLFGYKLFVSDGTLGPTVQGAENIMGSFVWEEVGSVNDNSESFITFEDVFAAQRVQRIFFSHRNNVRDTGTYGQFKTLEIEAYGQGYIPGVTMTSDLQDLSRSKNITTIEWEADIAPGTALAISSRTGDRLTEELHYFDKKGNELTFERWEALPNFRKDTEPTVELVPDPQDFSPWSQPYAQSGARFGFGNSVGKGIVAVIALNPVAPGRHEIRPVDGKSPAIGMAPVAVNGIRPRRSAKAT